MMEANWLILEALPDGLDLCVVKFAEVQPDALAVLWWKIAQDFRLQAPHHDCAREQSIELSLTLHMHPAFAAVEGIVLYISSMLSNAASSQMTTW